MFKNSLFSFSSCLPHLILTTWLYSCCHFVPFVCCKCLDNQKSLLLEFKNNLTFDEHVATDKLSGWNQSTDCCQWSGVECNRSNGRVIGLDLSEENITGGINNSSSLFHMQYLQRLNLADNHMQGEMPSAFGKLTSLTYLNLAFTGFSGQVPIEISQLVKLVVLDLSDNSGLYMDKPNLATIIQNMTDLNELYLDGVKNSAMGNRWCHALSSSLPHLQVLSMSKCHLRGEIHKSLSNLKHLSKINLDDNLKLIGPLPEFLGDFANLTSLKISGTTISGTIPMNLFQIPTLRTLDLSSNRNLQGILPEFSKSGSLEVLSLSGINFASPLTSSITNLKRLRFLDLDSCQFHGSIPSSIGNLNRLEIIKFAYNQFQGPIPKSLFQLKELESLYLSSNRLNGTLQLAEFLHSFKKLTTLDLSNNTLSTDGCNVNSSFPQLKWLALASCNLHSIPEFLKNQTQLQNLDLSMNHITGKIPRWMWGIQHYLDLSNNHFVELDSPLQLSNTSSFSLSSLDLHSNNLQGKFDVLLSNLGFLDCSSNNFTSIHFEIDNHMSSAKFISFSRNSLYGSIPTSLCNATYLEVLNLEYNHLSGKIPDCLLATPQLNVLNLRRNNLSGDIPDKFGKGCSLQTFQVNKNFLQGKIPPSLAHCRTLKVLDLGYNQLYDTFPCHLESLSNLHVLILRSNNLHGTMTCLKGGSIWPLLQIVDLASNNFCGKLSTHFLIKRKSMMNGTNIAHSAPRYLESDIDGANYYQNSVAVTYKGLSYDLQYILTIFCSIDVSNNAFHGELPTELGNLNALKVLNVSHNLLSGHIPPSLGNLSQIESLDLSCNTFSGKIPPQLSNLNFLEYLNLSYNQLSGKIPTGTQLQTFGVSSYEGNQGLYGPPLPDPVSTPSISSKGSSWSSKDQIEWMLMGAEVGIPVGITIFLAPLLYITRYREWYCKYLHNLVMKILCKEDGPKGRRRSRQQRQRR